MLNIDDITHPEGDKRYRIANADGKVWVCPTRNLRTAMELYQPSGRNGRLLKLLLPHLHRLAPVRRIAHTSTLSASLHPEIIEAARRAFGTDALEYSIFGGTPSVHRKITIQFHRDKRILGYAKLTDSKEIKQLFRHEQQLLESLQKCGISGIPKCLECGQLPSGRYIFIQTTAKTLKSYSPDRWTPLHEEFLSRLASKTAVDVAFEDSDFARSLRQLEDALPNIPEEYRNTIANALKAVWDHYTATIPRFSAFHADFTPWNMFVTDGHLFVFDWEYARLTYPPMLDRYHFHVQQAIHVGHLPADEIRREIESQPWYDPIDFRSYLLDIISRFVGRENGRISPSLDAMLSVWAKLLK